MAAGIIALFAGATESIPIVPVPTTPSLSTSIEVNAVTGDSSGDMETLVVKTTSIKQKESVFTLWEHRCWILAPSS